jgi:peptidoglycan/LPS O-acetylase OafA/YrhL
VNITTYAPTAANDADHPGTALTKNTEHDRLKVLDGWRGISILSVLAGHLLPLGPKPWHMNAAVAATGMVLFFILSGFLITNFLLAGQSVRTFFIRRLCRIVPLAWLYIAVALFCFSAKTSTVLPHLLFYANLPPFFLTDQTAHLWSLCVEVHFYLLIGLLAAFAGPRALPLLIVAGCLGVTALRIHTGTHISIVTWLRLDEILSGAFLAVVYRKWPEWLAPMSQHALLPVGFLALTLLASHESTGAFNYLRPYFAALCVGATVVNRPGRLQNALKSRILSYIAEISFALYIIHPLLAATWLGSGEGWSKYSKRPILILVLFVLAHLSTRYYEHAFISWGKRLTQGKRSHAEPVPAR